MAILREQKETKDERKSRLISAGRWDEFVKRREELRRNPDLTGAEANRKADEEFRKYGAEETNVVNTNAPIKTVPLEEFTNKEPISELEVVRWVFENFMNASASPATAPSVGAYGLLMVSRKNPQPFYFTLWMKVLSRQADNEVPDARKASGEQVLDLIEEIKAAVDTEVNKQLTSEHIPEDEYVNPEDVT